MHLFETTLGDPTRLHPRPDSHRGHSEGEVMARDHDDQCAPPRIPPRPRQISTPWEADDDAEEPIYEKIDSGPVNLGPLGEVDVFLPPVEPRGPKSVLPRSPAASHMFEFFASKNARQRQLDAMSIRSSQIQPASTNESKSTAKISTMTSNSPPRPSSPRALGPPKLADV